MKRSTGMKYGSAGCRKPDGWPRIKGDANLHAGTNTCPPQQGLSGFWRAEVRLAGWGIRPGGHLIFRCCAAMQRRRRVTARQNCNQQTSTERNEPRVVLGPQQRTKLAVCVSLDPAGTGCWPLLCGVLSGMLRFGIRTVFECVPYEPRRRAETPKRNPATAADLRRRRGLQPRTYVVESGGISPTS